MEQTKILVVDDNPEIREILRILLENESYEVTEAGDGAAALLALSAESFDLIILDIMMPHLDGYQTCLKIRESSNAPILFLSAKTKESDKTLGFSSGGDDYLAKPFSYNELVSRAKALIRRYRIYQGKSPQEEAPPPKRAELLSCGKLTIDPTKQLVSRDGVPVELTDTEYEILLLLLSHRGQIFPASQLYEAVWNEPYHYTANNTVMVHIRNLRCKIEEDATHPNIIKTVWGKGYRCD